MACAAALSGQSPLVAQQEQVNTYTTGAQFQPAVASLADGRFMVVWHSDGSPGADNSGYSVQMQRFASDGGLLGGQMQVNAYRAEDQLLAAITARDSESFVVVWQSYGSPGTDDSSYSIQLRRFDSSGEAVGAEMQVNTYTTGAQNQPQLAMASSGAFAVVWQSAGSPGPDGLGYSVQVRLFASDGSPVGGEFEVNTYSTSQQKRPDVAAATGGFVVVWESDGSASTDDSNTSIQLQRLDSAGAKVDGEFQVNSYTTILQESPFVASTANDEFVVVWTSYGSQGNDAGLSRSVQRRRFGSTGRPNEGQLQVNSYTTDLQFASGVQAASDGSSRILWHSLGSPGNDNVTSSVQQRHFANDGSPTADQTQVNTYTTGSQAGAVAVNIGGRWVAIWQSEGSPGNDDSSFSIQMTFLDTPIFAEGFESGDTSAWSLTTP